MHKVFTLILALAAFTAAAPSASAVTADSIMQHIDARDGGLSTFEARVHVDLRMTSFPWFSSNLDGTEYYKHPDKHSVIFDRAPSYAKGINSLVGAIDAPSEWRKDSNVAYEGLHGIDGKQLYELRMTKKIYSDQIKDTIAYVDPVTYEVVRMDFHYLNGDAITMTQTYKRQGNYTLVASRHLDIKRRVRAIADATYASYQTNVAVSDAVFEQKK